MRVLKARAPDTLEIEGVSALHGATYEIMPDRIEAGTYLVAAAATRGDVKIEGIALKLLGSVMDKLALTGAEITYGEDWVSSGYAG